MMSARSKLGIAIACAVVLAGCGGRGPAIHYYVLESPDPEPPAAASADGVRIGVDAFSVDPPYDQDRIVYRVDEHAAEIGFYAYHRWAAPLARMLPRVVAAAYRDMDGVSVIEPVGGGSSYDFLLRGRVLGFEEIDTAETQQARVRIELALHGEDGERLWSQSFTRQTSLTNSGVEDVVRGLRAALDETLDAAGPGLLGAVRGAAGP